MDQEELFHEDIYSALWHVVSATGGSKKVASELRPDIAIDQASRWLANCLDRSRSEKLDPEQVIWLLKRGREYGTHAGMYHLCDDTGYARPETVDPEDAKDELRREYIAHVKRIEALSKRMERL